MEKLKANVNMLFSAILLFISALGLAVYLAGYKFKPASYTAFAVITATLFVGAAVLSVVYRKSQCPLSRICGPLMPIFTVVFGIIFFLSLECKPIYVRLGYSFPIFLDIGLEIPATIIFFASLNRTWAKVTCGIITGVIACFMSYWLFIAVMFVFFGITTVENEQISPDRTYTAWVEICDEGALGGDVSVCVRNTKKEKFILIGTLKCVDYYVKTAGWGMEMNISWQDNENLKINDEIFNIPELLHEEE